MTVPIVDDFLVEPTEKFKVKMITSSVPSVKLGKPTTVNINLQDNDGKVKITLNSFKQWGKGILIFQNISRT